jgi:hypothetical protein
METTLEVTKAQVQENAKNTNVSCNILEFLFILINIFVAVVYSLPGVVGM